MAGGDASVSIPFSTRADEIGVFQQAMQHIKELSGKIFVDSDAEKRNRTRMSEETVRFSAEVEATLAELSHICDQMLSVSTTPPASPMRHRQDRAHNGRLFGSLRQRTRQGFTRSNR